MFRPSLGSHLVTQVCFHCSYVFMRNFSYSKVLQLASEFVVELSGQSVSQTLYFKNSLFRIEQLMMLFAAQEVPYWFRVRPTDIACLLYMANKRTQGSWSQLTIRFYITMKKSEKLQHSCSSLHDEVYNTVILIYSAPRMQLCNWLLASIICMYVWMD